MEILKDYCNEDVSRQLTELGKILGGWLKNHTKVCYENLLAAAHQASKGKRSNPSVMAFFEKLEDNLFDLQIQLQTQNYCHCEK